MLWRVLFWVQIDQIMWSRVIGLLLSAAGGGGSMWAGHLREVGKQLAVNCE